MGEAFYYLKGDNCTEKAFDEIKKFIKEGSESEEFWQDSRGIYDSEKIEGDNFWIPFKKKFPMISKYLKLIKKFGGNSNNALAGYLDFGREDDFENLEFDEDYTDDETGDKVGQIKYSAMVWHMADWNGFAQFLQKEFGLKNVRWISDEEIDPYDVL